MICLVYKVGTNKIEEPRKFPIPAKRNIFLRDRKIVKTPDIKETSDSSSPWEGPITLFQGYNKEPQESNRAYNKYNKQERIREERLLEGYDFKRLESTPKKATVMNSIGSEVYQ